MLIMSKAPVHTERDPSAGLYGCQFVACDLCESDEYEVLYPNNIRRDLQTSDFTVYGELCEHPRIVRCRNCSLVYVNPRDDVDALHGLYQSMTVESYLEEGRSREATFRSSINLISNYMSAGNVLDIGCSAGLFLKMLPKTYEAYGLEPCMSAAHIAQQQFGKRIICGTVRNTEFEDEFFNLVTMWDVVEHLESPRRALLKAHRWTRTGGFLVLVTPDFGSLTARVMGTRWPHLIRQHLFYFTKATLEKLLASVGYEIVQRSTLVRKFSLGYLLKRGHVIKRERKGLGYHNFPLFGSILRIRVPITLFDDLFLIAKKLDN